MKKLASNLDFSEIPQQQRPVTLDQKIQVIRQAVHGHADRMASEKVGWKRKNLRTNYFIWLENMKLSGVFKYY